VNVVSTDEASVLLEDVRRHVNDRRLVEAAGVLTEAVAAGAVAHHPYQVLACFAGIEAARGHGFRAYRLAGAAARQRLPQADDCQLAVAHWLAALLLHAGRHLSDDSSSTEWLWGNRMSVEEALAYAGVGPTEA